MGTIDVEIQDYKKAKAQKHPYGFAKVSRNMIQILSNFFLNISLWKLKKKKGIQIQLFTPYLLVWEMFRNSVIYLCLVPCLRGTMCCKPVQHFNGQNVCLPFLLAENYQNYDINSENMPIAWLL